MDIVNKPNGINQWPTLTMPAKNTTTQIGNA
jgi:hypothetical protein